jgi:diguanylate cyclase (GGDEF)-like protein/PAS domain S-box-containing protein
LDTGDPTTRWAVGQKESFLKTIFDALPGSVGYWDADLICRFQNRVFFEWFGKTPQSVIGEHYPDVMGEPFFRSNEAEIRGALAGKKQCFERTVPNADGGSRHLLVNYIPDADDTGAVTGFFVLLSDVTQVKIAEAQLEIGATVFQHAADGIVVTDESGTILSVNPAFTEITGYSAAEAVGQNPRLLKSDRQDREFYTALWAALIACGRWQGEIWNKRKSGELYIQRNTITKIHSAVEETVRYVSVFNDVTEVWRKNERLRHLAFHDELTDLPNRPVLMDRLDDEIEIAARAGQCLGVMFVDLDGFKAVNDHLGHGVGDALLEKVARKLQALTRRTDMVARIGGDEFVALILNVRGEEPVARIAGNMIAAINKPLRLLGTLGHISASIGIAMFPAHGATGADLMREADAAMYAAKDAGKNTYCFAPSPSVAVACVANRVNSAIVAPPP